MQDRQNVSASLFGGEASLFERRLREARWVLAAAAAVLAVATAVFDVPVVFAAFGFIAIFGAATLLPRRPTVPRRVDPQDKSSDLWPDDSVKMAVESLPDAGFVIDQRGILRYVNGVAERLFGPVRPGDPFSFRLRVPSLLQALDRVSSGAPAERVQWSEKVPTERWFEAHIAPMVVPGKEPAERPGFKFVLAVVRDLTEQRRLERMRADFVANASHELRTPLASLRGFIDTLQGPARDDPDARVRFLAIMNDQAARMSRLIDDLLSLSRIEMREHLRPATVVDLRDVLGHVVDAMAPLAGDYDVELQDDLPPTALHVRGDHDELVQMFENLIQNAIKYGSDGERVLVSAFTMADDGAGEEIAVTIRDWGPGIAQEHLPRLTERFYRIDVETSREKQGTGLGLAIVKHILNRHRAVLSIENAADAGAVFTVRFEPATAPRNGYERAKNN